jgi:hypothetical protein
MITFTAESFVALVASGFGLFALVIGYQSLADNLRHR